MKLISLFGKLLLYTFICTEPALGCLKQDRICEHAHPTASTGGMMPQPHNCECEGPSLLCLPTCSAPTPQATAVCLHYYRRLSSSCSAPTSLNQQLLCKHPYRDLLSVRVCYHRPQQMALRHLKVQWSDFKSKFDQQTKAVEPRTPHWAAVLQHKFIAIHAHEQCCHYCLPSRNY